MKQSSKWLYGVCNLIINWKSTFQNGKELLDKHNALSESSQIQIFYLLINYPTFFIRTSKIQSQAWIVFQLFKQLELIKDSRSYKIILITSCDIIKFKSLVSCCKSNFFFSETIQHFDNRKKLLNGNQNEEINYTFYSGADDRLKFTAVSLKKSTQISVTLYKNLINVSLYEAQHN